MIRMIRTSVARLGRRLTAWALRRTMREVASKTTAGDALKLPQQATSRSQRSGLLRWSYLLTRGTIAGVVWAFFAFGFDPLLRIGLQSALERQLGARAELQAVRTGFFPPTVRITGLRLANRNRPGRNLFECEELRARLDGEALLRKAIVIDDGEAVGLRWNTHRDDSGLLDEGRSDRADGSAHPLAEALKTFGRILSDGLAEKAKEELDPRSLESVRLAEQLRVQWQRDFDELESRIKKVKRGLDAIRQRLKQSQGNVLEQIGAYRKIAVDAERLLRELDQVRRETEKLPDKARSDLQRLDEAKQRDVERLKKKAALVRLDPEELSQFLFGPRLGPYVADSLEWLRWSRQRKHLERSPERARGRWVLFPRQDRLPDFLVRQLRIAGRGEIAGADVTLSGAIRDWSSAPRQYGRPTIVELAGQGDADVQIKLILDETQPTPKHHVQVAFAQKRPSRIILGQPDLLEMTVVSRALRWQLELQLTGDRVDGRLRWHQAPVQLEPALQTVDVQSEVARFLRQAVADIHEVEATLLITGNWPRPNFQVQSNLGAVVAKGLTAGLDRLVREQQQRLAAQLEGKLTAELNELTSQFNDRYAGLLRSLQNGQQILDDAAAKISRSPLPLDRLFRR
ncbi:MAG: TIGR03545 family protein [Planctomycetes bacterium]|nr:TIGR03545 family protein [Planctomycetota bacterium]